MISSKLNVNVEKQRPHCEQSDLIVFKKSRNYVTFLMNKARQDSDLISNNSNDLKHRKICRRREGNGKLFNSISGEGA